MPINVLYNETSTKTICKELNKMKKILSILLILALSLGSCLALADGLDETYYRPLGETGYEMWFAPELEPLEITDAMKEAYYVGYYISNSSSLEIAVQFFPDFEVTIEEYAEALKQYDDVSEITITTAGEIPVITYLIKNEGYNVHVMTIIMEDSFMEVCFVPYNDENTIAIADQMKQSLRLIQE